MDGGKAPIVGAVVIGAVVFAKRRALSRNGFDIETFVERMPDNAPPKWAFNNISAIRENTDRILSSSSASRSLTRVGRRCLCTTPTRSEPLPAACIPSIRLSER